VTPHELSTWPRGLPRDIDIPPTNLCANLLVSAMRSPRRAVLVDDFGSLAYAELVEQVERIAAFLQNELGVQRGDRVLICLQNGRGWVAAYYAVLRINAVVVPVNPMNKRDELPHYLSDTGAVAAFCGSDNVAELLAVPAAQQLRRVIIVGSPGPADVPADTVAEGAGNLGNPARTIGLRRVLATAPGPLAPLEHLPDALALILYSSGSTGAPKGCMHTHRTLTASTVIVAHWMGLVPHSVQLVALPYFHITGMQNLLNAPIYGGGTLVLMKRWNRDEAAALIARHQVSHWTAMPTMVIDFLASPRLAEYDLRSVRRIGGGGAGMPEAVGERLKALTGLDFLEGYGLSETAHVSGNPPAAFKRQCLGVPLFNTDLRVIDPDTSAELPPGEVGEIVMAGPQVFTGYWRNEEATRSATLLLDGKRFVRSGDPGAARRGGLLLHRRPAQAHGQRLGLQGVAGRGRGDAARAPGHRRSLRDRGRRRLPRRDGQGRGGAARRAGRSGARGRHRRMGEAEDGRLQVPAAGGVRGRAAQDRHREDRLAAAAGGGACEGAARRGLIGIDRA
jgi:fatty-acyl-CoA synthase